MTTTEGVRHPPQQTSPNTSLQKRLHSLRFRLIALLSLVLMITILVIGASVLFFIYRNEQRSWQGRQAEAAHYAATTVSAFILRAQNMLKLVSLLDPTDLSRNPQVMDDLLAQSPSLLEVIRLDSNGNAFVGAYQDAPLLANLFTTPQARWFIESKAGRVYLGNIQISADSEPYLILSIPANDGGVVAARLRMNVLWDVVTNLHFGNTGQAYVVNSSGQIIAHTDPQVALNMMDINHYPQADALLQTTDQNWAGSYRNVEGIQVVGVTERVPGTNWVVITELPQTEAFATTRVAMILLGGGMILVGLLVILVTSRFLSAVFLRPMEKLRDGVERIGHGDLAYRINIEQQNEVGAVATAFNEMAQRLSERDAQLAAKTSALTEEVAERKQTELALRESEEKYRLVVENATEAIVVAQDGQLKFFNPRLVEMSGGYTAEELKSQSFTAFLHPDDQAMVMQRHQQRLQGEALPNSYEFRIINKQNLVKWAEISVIPIIWGGKPATLFFLNDINERVEAETALRASEEKYRQLVKFAPAGIYEVDLLTGKFLSVNDVMCEYTGYSKDEFLNLTVVDIMSKEDSALLTSRQRLMLSGGDLPEAAEYKIKGKNYREFWVLINSRVTYEDETPLKATVVAHDITERKQMEIELQEHRDHLEELVKERTTSLMQVNQQLQTEIIERKETEIKLLVTSNRQALLYYVLSAINGQIEIDAIAHSTTDAIVQASGWAHVCFATPQNGNWVIRATAGQLKSEVGLSFPMERGIIGRAFRTGQTQLLVDVSADPAYLGQDPALKSMLTVPILQGSHVLAVLNLEHTEPAAFGPEEQKLAESLAEALALGMENARLFEAAQVELARRQQIQAQISASLEEKVILLKEIHHRVKNNLQVISSLLDLQANQSKDPYTLEMFKDSQNRVKSMALIHEQLYQSDDLSRIDFGQYLNSLVNQLRHSYNTKAQQIVINLDATHVPLTIETAIPCGLIVNELVSNAFKYAFPEGHPLPHEITIKLSEISPNKLVLCIFDNGVGLPPGIDLTRAKTLGLRLVNNLVRQIKGQIQIHRNGGTRLDITFNL